MPLEGVSFAEPDENAENAGNTKNSVYWEEKQESTKLPKQRAEEWG